jgi:dihydrofolate reductase
MISAIAAVDSMGMIGCSDGPGLLWGGGKLPRDMARFRRITLGKPVVMGRKTWETIPNTLPERLNIVLTSEAEDWGPGGPGYYYVGTIREAIRRADNYNERHYGDEVVIIGGGDVFSRTVHLWDRVYLTRVDADLNGDIPFPMHVVESPEWFTIEREEHPPDARNQWGLTFEVYRPKRPIHYTGPHDFLFKGGSS